MSEETEPKTKEEEKEESDEEEKRVFENLKEFPQNTKNYVVFRLAGADILSPVQEEEANLKGSLEMNDDSGTAAMFWVKCPHEKGLIAGRIDHVGPTGERPITYFEALACKAHLDYGDWDGVVHRTGGPGNYFTGTQVSWGRQLAVVGGQDVSAQEPLCFTRVHSMYAACDEADVYDTFQEGYIPMKKGYIGFTLFFSDGDYNQIPLTLWFRPKTNDDDDDKASIPLSLVQEIQKLPARLEEDDVNSSSDESPNAKRQKTEKRSSIDVLKLLKEYLEAYDKQDIAAIADMIDPDVEVFVDGKQTAQGRDTILPSYQDDFDAGKTVSVGVEPCVVQDGVVQVGLVSVEPASSEDKTRTTTSLTVRYHYNNEGKQIRHEISDVVVKSGDE